MIIARWNITARFGHAQEVIGLLREWNGTFGKQLGLPVDHERIVIGSIGARESLVQTELEVESLAKLEEAFTEMGKLEGHAAWGKKLEPHVVSGTNHWEIFRRA